MTNDMMRGINAEINAMQRRQNNIFESIQEQNRIKEEREIRLLEATEQTARNTAVLPEMLGLIRESNEKQDEVFDIIVEILSISKSASKEEAESKYRRAMKKVTDFSGDIETTTKLVGYASTAWSIVEKMF